jgi:uncharacterized protein
MYRYTLTSILVAFGATFLTFAVMSIYGALTKQDLTRWGQIAMFGLIGLLIGTFINILVSIFAPGFGQGMYWILTYVGIGLFVILIAYDSQKLKRMAENANGQNISSLAINGALQLYLDFINIFIRVLLIMGKKK